MELFRVTQEPMILRYGSHTRHLSGTHSKTWPIGSVLQLDDESPNGNVWFIDPDGERGKIEAGSVSNLICRGSVRELESRTS